jgi:replication factor C subunit 1
MGGHVVSAVSGRTDFLVTGYILENNKPIEEGSKYKKALIQKSNGKPLSIITEEEFFKMYPLPLCTSPANVDDRVNTNIILPEPALSTCDTEELNVVFPKKYIVISFMTFQLFDYCYRSVASQDLWFEKYRPVKSSQIIGNSENIRRLKAWLTNWYDICLGKRDTFVDGGLSKKRFSNNESVLMSIKQCHISGFFII